MTNWTVAGSSDSVVVPILPAGVAPPAVLGQGLDRLIPIFYQGNILATIPDLFRTADIGGEFRAFISYRRADSQALADQLFDGLNARGFRVFLDRPCGTPGRSFPPLLAEQLIDKRLVVVIESPSVSRSAWTQAEILFARLYRLGLVSIEMPPAQRFAAIVAGNRYRPPGGAWLGSGSQRELRPAELQRFLDFVSQRFAMQVLARRYYLNTLLATALAGAGLPVIPHRNGCIETLSRKGSVLFEMSPIPPRVTEFRRLLDLGRARSATWNVAVGPSSFLPRADRSNMAWLAGELGVLQRPESFVRTIARNISKGQPP
jgi:hypothetical protein